MKPSACRTTLCYALLFALASPAMGAELSDLMPQDTLLYLAWPGAEACCAGAKDTAWGKMMDEPELVRFREQWHKAIWPAIDRRLRQEVGEDAAAYDAGMTLLKAAWQYPTAFGLAGVGITPNGPQIDAALIIRAGKDTDKLRGAVGNLLASAGGGEKPRTREVTVGKARLQEAAIPGAPVALLYGAMGDDFVISIGPHFQAHWSGGPDARPLTGSDRFAMAMKTIGGGPGMPVFYLDLEGVVATLERFQPLFAQGEIPILGEAGGVRNLLKGFGLGSLQSLSAACKPEAGGFKTTVFVHAPGLNESPALASKPLTDEDLKRVPRDVSWATVSNFDLAAGYRALRSAFETIAPDVYKSVMPSIEAFEGQIGVKIDEDLLSSFGDTWALYDAPANAGFWLTGIVLIGELRPDNRLDASMDKIVQAIATAVGDENPVTLREETYRGAKIRYVNVANAPMPLAPAWAAYKGQCIMGCFPQMVRSALDHLMEGGPSLVDHPDFQRGRKLMPAGFDSISFTDTPEGIRQLYSLALPLATAGFSMAQGEDIPLDASLLPSARTLTKHLFGNTAAYATTKDGVIWVSYGGSPVGVPAVGAAGTAATVGTLTAIMLPSLARARNLAKRTVGAASLRNIGVGLHVYAADHDGKFPPDLNTLVKEGMITPQVLIAPNDESGSECSYEYLPNHRTDMDPRQIIAYEKETVNDGDGVNVLFLDGHVEFMRMPDFKAALEKSRERLKAGAKPGPAGSDEEEPK